MSKPHNLARKSLILLGAALVTTGAWSGSLMDWEVDEDHTEINFTTKHFFTPVTGKFGSYDVQLDYDAERPERSTVAVRIDVASIDTGNERRDDHLRTADWFDAERWPSITFRSTSVRRVAENRLVAVGDLTIRGVTKQIELPIEILGVQDIPSEMQEMLMGAERVASFHSTLTIDRGEFEVGSGSWAQTMIVAGDVDIEIALEAADR
ncbi:MAG: YceI family protein [Gemmatimonadota bacterium]